MNPPRKPPLRVVGIDGARRHSENPGKPSMANVIRFPSSSNGHDPEPTDPVPVSGCRPCVFILDDNRRNILLAVRKRRHRRVITAQYGLPMDELFEVLADRIDELEGKKAA